MAVSKDGTHGMWRSDDTAVQSTEWSVPSENWEEVLRGHEAYVSSEALAEGRKYGSDDNTERAWQLKSKFLKTSEWA